ncbi:MAG: SIMPL domain-containing protein [Bacillota bacterium]|nr:SIMPL domain-containing protein [Bacillota bacterium]
MRKKQIFYTVALLVIIVLSLSGCGSDDQSNPGTAEAPRVIQTYGEAEIKAKPDLAEISVAIQTRGTDAGTVAEDNARLANAVWNALLDYGLSEDDLKTGAYSIYSYQEWVGDRLTGEKSQMSYQAVNEIIIKTTELESVGEIIDLAVEAGANNVNYVNFELADPQELLMKALAMAAEQASLKAEAIAGSTGDSITGLYSIREERTDYIPFTASDGMMREEAEMAAAPTPINPDQVTVKATVMAEYTIK